MRRCPAPDRLQRTMVADVRPARADELGPVAAALRASGLGSNVGRLLEFPHDSPSGQVLVATQGREVVGGAAVAGFGATGWIGALGVMATARRHRSEEHTSELQSPV